MKKILVPAFAILCLLTACKEEKSAAPQSVQEGALAPVTVEGFVPTPEFVSKPAEDGYIDTTRYAMDGVNEYQLGDSLLGTWQGVEGTSLVIARDPAGKEYNITITNLDGPRSFPGKAAKEGIQFERDGKTETIRMGDGVDTGMKWLADKVDCVVITAGSEGFCRDEAQPLDAETK